MENIIVIKIGGVASQHLSQDFINQIKKWKEAGKQLVIVHGGGFAINKLMEEEHVPVKKINGRLLIAFNSCLILKKSFRLIS